MRKASDLRPDQDAVITALYESDGLFAVMRMGGGKTASILTAFAELQKDGIRRKMIVLAPPLVVDMVWPREPAKWEHLQHLKVVSLTGGPKERATALLAGEADVYCISDAVIPWLCQFLDGLPTDHPLLDIVTYDEPKTKSHNGAQGKALCSVRDKVKTFWFASGTPRPNGFMDLFMPSRILTRGKAWGDDFEEFRRRNFMSMDWGDFHWEPHDFRIPQMQATANSFMVQAPEPPDARHGTMSSGAEYDIEIDLPPHARALYKRMERDMLAQVKIELGSMKGSNDEHIVVALSRAVASAKLAQIAQGHIYDEGEAVSYTHEAKVDALKLLLDSIGAEPTIIVYGFREDLNLIDRVMKGRRWAQIGGKDRKSAMRDMDLWNEGKLDNLIIHPASAGHGVELQFGGRRMIHFCPTWSAEQYDQILKRIDRPGQTKHCYSHQIIARDTVDIVKRNRVEYKMRDQDAFRSMLDQL